MPFVALQTAFWTTANEGVVAAYLTAATNGLPLPIILPTPAQVAATGYQNTLNHAGPIAGLAVARTTRLLPEGVNNAAVLRPCMQVGARIFIVIYENATLGDRENQCPFPNFHECVLRDLRSIASQDSGVRLLQSIDAHGDGADAYVYIRFVHGMMNPWTAEMNWAGPGHRPPGRLTDQGVPGACVRHGRVQYNPMFFGVPKMRGLTDRDPAVQPGKWGAPEQKPPDVTLFHELVHADDALRGIFDDIEIPRGREMRKLSEIRCVGLDEFDNASIVSENNFRRQRGMAVRDYYTSPTETKGAAAVHARKTTLLAHLDTSLMKHGTFVANSSLTFGSRNKILTVEAALDTYNRLHSWRRDPADDLERVEQLIAVMKACEDYKQRNAAKRNIRTLVAAANDEILAIVNRAIQAANPPSRASFEPLRRLYHVVERGMRNVLGARTDGVIGPTSAPYPDTAAYSLSLVWSFTLEPAIKALQTALQPRQGPSHPEIAALQQQDLADLDAIAQSPTAPPVTQAMIAGLLAIARRPSTQLWDAGATSNAGILVPGPGYYVNYGQWNARDLRLGTFIHELTHVANHLTWANTPEMFSFPGDISDQMTATRKANLQELLGLVLPFDTYQRYWLGTKLNYGHTNVKGDYETVLNQSLIYLHLWGIPHTNPFHARLIQIAQVALNDRAAAQPAVVLPVLGQAPPLGLPPQGPPPQPPQPILGRQRGGSVQGPRPTLLGSEGRPRSKTNPLL